MVIFEIGYLNMKQALAFVLSVFLLPNLCFSEDSIPVKIPGTLSLDLHSQSSAIIDFGSQHKAVKSTTLWQNKHPTTICDIVPARILQRYKKLMAFHQKNKYLNTSQVLYKLSDLTHLKNAIDLIEFKGKYYVVFEQGTIEIYDMKEGKLEPYAAAIRKDGQQFDEGFFVKNKEDLLYVTSKDVHRIDNTDLIPLDGYIPTKNFESVFLADKSLMVALGTEGIAMYLYENHTLGTRQFYNSSVLGQGSDVSDLQLTTYEGSRYIILTERLYGIFRINIDKGAGFQKIVSHQNCEAVHLYQNYVIAACPNLLIYDFKTGVTLERGSPQIFPQDILVQKTQKGAVNIYLVGDSHIAFYQGIQAVTPPIYSELFMPSKVLLAPNNKLVYINDFEIIQTQMSTRYQVVECGKNSLVSNGNYNLEVHVVGPCNQKFIQSKGVSGKYDQSKFCQYIYEVKLLVWSERKIYWHIPVVVGAIVGVIGILFGAWYCFRNCKLQKQYHTLADELGVLAQSQKAPEQKEQKEEKEAV